ncbi:MAG TPA: choice-of-anchor Q domain-containing protein [Dehalococcoidia bacterium]|nr:choice-of-anchor Q domain-containing protein [Dehalococcoidia bacterium]
MVENAATAGGGISNVDDATVTIKNTIVGFNGGDCFGRVTSLGHNANVDGTCALTGPGDFAHAVIDLAPLGENGGPTQTHALPRLDQRSDVIVQNDAIDGGDPANCPSTDQRGEPRPFDGDGDGAPLCDIGAFELREEPLRCQPVHCMVVAATPSPTSALPVILPPSGGGGGHGTFPISGVVATFPLALVVASGVLLRARRR